MKKSKLKELYEKYKLDKDDFWTQKVGKNTYTIVSRAGIEKIQNQEQLVVRFEALVVGPTYCAVKCYVSKSKGEKQIQTFSSALNDGKNKNTYTNYVLEMAEKRAFARGVLKFTEFYQHGVFSEDEADSFKKTENSINLIKQ